MTCHCGAELRLSLWRRPANAYYWAVMVPTFARELFMDIHHRNVHEQIKVAHVRLKYELLPFGDDPGEALEQQGRSISVSKMCNDCFRDYLNRLSMLAGMNGIEFPTRLPEGDDDGEEM